VSRSVDALMSRDSQKIKQSVRGLTGRNGMLRPLRLGREKSVGESSRWTAPKFYTLQENDSILLYHWHWLSITDTITNLAFKIQREILRVCQ
jgi:hypothetical protein